MLRRENTVSHKEVDDDKIAVEFDLIGFSDETDHFLDGQQLKTLNLAVRVFRFKIFREFQIVGKELVALDEAVVIHENGDESVGAAALCQGLRDSGFLPALPDDDLPRALSGGESSCHKMIEVARIVRASFGTAGDPHPEPLGLLDEAVEVNTVAANPQKLCGGAFHEQERFVVKASGNAVQLVPPSGNPAAFLPLRQHLAHGTRPGCRRVEMVLYPNLGGHHPKHKQNKHR